jgi:hypothetical protein
MSWQLHPVGPRPRALGVGTCARTWPFLQQACCHNRLRHGGSFIMQVQHRAVRASQHVLPRGSGRRAVLRHACLHHKLPRWLRSWHAGTRDSQTPSKVKVQTSAPSATRSEESLVESPPHLRGALRAANMSPKGSSARCYKIILRWRINFRESTRCWTMAMVEDIGWCGVVWHGKAGSVCVDGVRRDDGVSTVRLTPAREE